MENYGVHGGNFPHAKAGSEDFGGGPGGSVTNGLSMKDGFVDVMPEELGMGNAGPNQMPIGPSEHGAARGHKWG